MAVATTSLTSEQRDARSKGIGGSDAAAAIGISPWKTPVQLWQEKLGLTEPANDDEFNERLFWGIRLEPIIAEVWAERMGWRIESAGEPFRDPELPFMVANPDRLILDRPAGLEVKNSSEFMAARRAEHLNRWGEDGSDEIPLYYLTQAAHYMRVCDLPEWYFAVLIGGNELRTYRVERDEEQERTLIELESRFWECVERQIPPPMIELADVVRLYPRAEGQAIATPEIAELVATGKALRDEIKAAEKRLDRIKLELASFLGPKADLMPVGYDGRDPKAKPLATYRSSTVTRIDVKRLRVDDPSTAEAYSRTSTERRFLFK